MNGLIHWLFKWWLITSTVFWGLIGTLYLILRIWNYRLTGQ
jgi:hypothetical protein